MGQHETHRDVTVRWLLNHYLPGNWHVENGKLVVGERPSRSPVLGRVIHAMQEPLG